MGVEDLEVALEGHHYEVGNRRAVADGNDDASLKDDANDTGPGQVLVLADHCPGHRVNDDG